MYYFDYNDVSHGAQNIMANFVGAAAVVFVMAIILFGILLYVFTAYAYYRMAKNRNMEHAWLAWIPVAQLYLLGMLIDKRVYFGSLKIDNAHVLLPIGLVLVPAVGFIPFIGYLLAVVYTIYVFGAHYRLYRIYGTSNQAVLFLILSIIFPITEPFFLFALKNKSAVEYQS